MTCKQCLHYPILNFLHAISPTKFPSFKFKLTTPTSHLHKQPAKRNKPNSKQTKTSRKSPHLHPNLERSIIRDHKPNPYHLPAPTPLSHLPNTPFSSLPTSPPSSLHPPPSPPILIRITSPPPLLLLQATKQVRLLTTEIILQTCVPPRLDVS